MNKVNFSHSLSWHEWGRSIITSWVKMSSPNPPVCSEVHWSQTARPYRFSCREARVSDEVERMKEIKKKYLHLHTFFLSLHPSVPKGFSYLRQSSSSPSSRYLFILRELTCEKASLTEEHESRLSEPDKVKITSYVRLWFLTLDPSPLSLLLDFPKLYSPCKNKPFCATAATHCYNKSGICSINWIFYFSSRHVIQI